MTLDLSDLFADDTNTPTLYIARVKTVDSDSCDLVIGAIDSENAAQMSNVAYMRHVTPAVNDIVYVLSHARIGSVIIGTQ